MAIKDWNIEAMIGYVPKTTFYTDFSIAEGFGKDAIIDTCNRAFNGWKSNTEYLTELVMALNWKIWEHYEHNNELAELYNSLWDKLDRWATTHLIGDDLAYYYRTTD